MYKGQVIAKAAKEVRMSKRDVNDALAGVLKSIREALKRGERVTFPGFGTFSPALRKARTGMDPRTRAPVQIPERKSAKFSVGSKFKAQVQGS